MTENLQELRRETDVYVDAAQDDTGWLPLALTEERAEADRQIEYWGSKYADARETIGVLENQYEGSRTFDDGIDPATLDPWRDLPQRKGFVGDGNVLGTARPVDR